jgi:predicted MFS family arabinose efflux permease
LYLTTGLPFGVLLALLFARWLLAAPGDTARQGMLPDLAARGDVTIVRATAAFDGAYRGGRLAGGSLAGLLVIWLGPASLLFIDGASFLLSAILIGSSVPRIAHDAGGPGLSGYLARLREGTGFLWRDQVMRAIAVIFLFSNMLDTGLTQVVLPAYAKATFHDPRVFGFLVAAVGAGAIAGNVAYGALAPRLPPRVTLAVSMLIAGAPRPLVLAAGAPAGAAVGVTAVSGFAAGPINPLAGAIQYGRIPARLRARVIGASTAIQYAGMPLGGLIASSLISLASLRAALVTFACVYLLLSVPPLLGRPWKQIKFPAPQPETPAGDAPAG